VRVSLVRVGSKSRRTNYTFVCSHHNYYAASKANLNSLVHCSCSRASCNKPVWRRTRDRHRRVEREQTAVDVDTSSAESISGDTPSPTIPMANPGHSRNEPYEEPDPESQKRTGSEGNNEMVDEDKRSMDLDHIDNIFDDVGAGVESPAAAIPKVSLFIPLTHKASRASFGHLKTIGSRPAHQGQEGWKAWTNAGDTGDEL
jgi:hypothetical protein